MKTLVIDACALKKGKSYGFNTYLLNLLEYFHNNRHKLVYGRIAIACDKTEINTFCKYEKFEVVGFDCGSYSKRYKVMRRLYQYFKLNKDDVILFPGNYSTLNKKCQHVLVIHDLLYLRPNWIKNRIFRIQRRLFVPRSIRLADQIIAISVWVKNDIMFHYPKQAQEKVVAVYSYFDFRKYGTNYSDAIVRLTKHPYLLVVSADYPHKHVGNVVEAYSKLAVYDKELALVIVGKMGSERIEQINSLSENIKGRIHILKDITNDDLACLYRNSKAYISATEFEGLGMPLVEAMYLGAKVFCSNIEVAREVTDGKAIYFDPTNVSELYDILSNMNKYQIPSTSKEAIALKFSAENTSGKYVEILNNLAMGK